MTGEKKKLVFMVTHGPEDPELATIPFVMATTALAMDADVIMGFQGNGVFLVKKGVADQVVAPSFPPLADLMNTYIEAGGKMYVCAPCIGSRKIAQEDLIDGATVAGAATFVTECVTATNVLVY